ncbi:bacteriohemerythrin [Geomonas sp. Red32]|uniref:bacteriohemerythrin n=1 Tax=Geomonas sp. Red32 TaxID=2912856 RepID=UPI00202CE246|nr:bacteriohemerythrin [Geomonas sp. Red32]MCM0083134.1 bacteriohemerythrin [Geomonas sp. Red32]
MDVTWSDDLATGVYDIDDQHKEIFRRFDRLFAACGQGKGKEEVLQLLIFLEDYVKEHFAAEEKLQMRSAYPDYTSHRAEHTRFVTDVAKLTNEFKSEGVTLSLVIMTNKTLAAWLVQHIRKTDMAFASYLRQQGK